MSEVEPEAAHSVPGDTTPTWEMELLVSGATVFGLMQLPQLIDHAYFRVANLSTQDYATPLMFLWMYCKVATISLVITFVVHLCLRGYWVALVGMNSVYPGGIRWQNMRMSAVSREDNARRQPDMRAIIENADNRATRVFAVGFGFAMLILKLAFAVLVLLVICVAFDASFGGGHASDVFGIALAVLALPVALAVIIDRRLGDRLAADNVLLRTARRVPDFYGRFGLGQRSNPLLALFTSHEGRPKTMAIITLFMLPVMSVLMMQNHGRLRAGAFVGLETDDPYSASSSPNAFYSDADDDSSGKPPLPHIPGRVVDGPYLPLFVPYVPRLHGPALEANCRAAHAAPAPAAARARLDCLARLSDIRIDGRPAAVALQASSDPATGQPGMLAMLPVASLAPGRHELSLSDPARASLDPSQPFRRYRIAFWK